MTKQTKDKFLKRAEQVKKMNKACDFLADIVKNYIGKQLGEKTNKKIAMELQGKAAEAGFGCYVWFCDDWLKCGDVETYFRFTDENNTIIEPIIHKMQEFDGEQLFKEYKDILKRLPQKAKMIYDDIERLHDIEHYILCVGYLERSFESDFMITLKRIRNWGN